MEEDAEKIDSFDRSSKDETSNFRMPLETWLSFNLISDKLDKLSANLHHFLFLVSFSCYELLLF